MSSQPETDAGALTPVEGEARSKDAGRGRKEARRRSGSPGQTLTKNWRLVSAAVLLVAGIVLVLLGWYGAANTNILTEQIPYLISGGLLGLGLIVVAGVLASAAALERENRELRADLRRLIAGTGTAGASVTRLRAEPFPSENGNTNGRLYIVPGGVSYHLAGCPILEGKQGVKELPRERVSAFAACKLCEPDSD